MRLNRFIGDYDLSKEMVEILDSKIIKQIKDVLRLKKGDEIILSDGKGKEARVTLVDVTTDKINGTVNKDIRARTPLARTGVARNVNLYLAILKKENFELAVQKAVECGVSKIIPVITERTIKTGINTERLEKIIREACEQSGRSFLPLLSPILDFKDAVLGAEGEKIIFHPIGKTYGVNQKTKITSIFVGPEGGFTENEIKLAKEAGFTVASLGALTLRGETAAIVGTYRAVHAV